MTVASMNYDRLVLSPVVGWPVAVGGLLAVFATYWDEAFHTDVGRDSAWAAPHLLLYGSIAVVGLGVAGWGLRVLVGTRSFRSCLAQPPLLAAGLGALGALAAAPIDAWWHEAYGRDAVLWSPPHMLVVLASTALVLGVLSGLPAQARALRAVAGVLMLANAAAVVFEYEAGVPQFSEVFYVPVLLVVGLAAVWMVNQFVPVRFPATTVVLGYAVLRVGIAGGLLVLGRSTPDLPIAVLGLAAFDLPLRRTSSRFAAAAVATSTLAWLASAGSLASPMASEVAVTAAPVIVIGLVFLLAGARRGLWVAPTLLLGLAVLVTGEPDPAQAHDPGQGDPITRLELTVTSNGDGHLTLMATARKHCDDLTPESVFARRAGETVTATLRKVDACRFVGELTVLTQGRWFVYGEFTHAGDPAEAWLPVSGSVDTVRETRMLYRPAGAGGGTSWMQVVSGVLIYVVGLGLVGVGVRAARSRRQPYRVSPRGL